MRTSFKQWLARRLYNLDGHLGWHINLRLRSWAMRLESGDWSAWSWPELQVLLDQIWTPGRVAGKAPHPRELRVLIATRWPELAEIEVGPEEALLWAVCLVGREARRAWYEREEPEPRELARLLAALETLEACRVVARPLAEQLTALRKFLKRVEDGEEGEL